MYWRCATTHVKHSPGVDVDDSGATTPQLHANRSAGQEWTSQLLPLCRSSFAVPHHLMPRLRPNPRLVNDTVFSNPRVLRSYRCFHA